MHDLSRRRALWSAAAAFTPALFGNAAWSASTAPPKPYEFFTLGDFTINLPAPDRKSRYLLVSVTLEVKSEYTQEFRDLAPRLKETVLRRLMQMSERNQLRPGESNPASVRENLYESLAEIKENGLKSVVITRFLHS